MSRLVDRPLGVRRSWRKVIPDLAAVGERLRNASPLVSPEWGDPVEAQEFRERKGTLRRVVAAYANGRYVSLSFRRDGSRLMISKVSDW